jgi:hypothetical protein
MNYCGHCGSRLDADGRCPNCSAAERAVPRIVEQTSSPLPPPTVKPTGPAAGPPPPEAARAVPLPPDAPPAPTMPIGPAVDQQPTTAMSTVAPATTAGQAAQPTEIIPRLEPLPSQWAEVHDDDHLAIDEPQSWRKSQLATVGVIAAILLLAGLGVVLWNLLADDPDSIGTAPDVATTLAPEPPSTALPPTTLPPPETTAPGTLPDMSPLTIAPTVPAGVPPTAPETAATVEVSAPATVPATPTDAPTEPAPAETDPPARPDATPPPQTSPPPTAPPATAPPATPPPATAPPATAPPPPPAGPGSPQVLQDPLPSGLSYGQVQTSHTLGQQLADALAAEDWDRARALSPPLANSSDATLASGYAGLDRASLMLVDARNDGANQRLLIVSVANELGSRTSLYCFEWMAQPAAGTVRQGGGVGRISQVPGILTPQQVREDRGLADTIRDRCVWS